MNTNQIDEREEELISLVEEEFNAYLSECDLDEDRCVDIDAFAKHTKEMIEHNHGDIRFDDYNIESYAKDYAEGRENDLFEYCEE